MRETAVVMRTAVQEMTDGKNTLYPEENASLLLNSMLNPDQTHGSTIRSLLLSLTCIFLYCTSWPHSFKISENAAFGKIWKNIYILCQNMTTVNIFVYFLPGFFFPYAYDLGLLKNSWNDKICIHLNLVLWYMIRISHFISL